MFQSLLFLSVTGCSSSGFYEYDLIPLPSTFSPVSASHNDGFELPYEGVLYVTDRKPADEDDFVRYYQHERDSLLRVGVAEVDYVGKPKTIAQLQRLVNIEPGEKPTTL